MLKPRASPVDDAPLRRRAKAGSIKVLLAVASRRERVIAVETGPPVVGEVLGILAKAGTLGKNFWKDSHQ